MRIYTVNTINEGGVVKPSDFNSENNQLASALALNLDGHNLPPSSITTAKLVTRTLDDSGDPFIISRGVWFDYFYMWLSGAGPTTALASITLSTSGHTGTWNSLSDLLSITDARQAFTLTTDGMMEGSVIVDWSRYYGYDSGTGVVPSGLDDWTNFGVFIDGQLVKESGWLYPRRETRWIPFFIALPAGRHTIEIKFQASRAPLEAADSSQDDSQLDIFQVVMNLKHWKR